MSDTKNSSLASRLELEAEASFFGEHLLGKRAFRSLPEGVRQNYAMRYQAVISTRENTHAETRRDESLLFPSKIHFLRGLRLKSLDSVAALLERNNILHRRLYVASGLLEASSGTRLYFDPKPRAKLWLVMHLVWITMQLVVLVPIGLVLWKLLPRAPRER